MLQKEPQKGSFCNTIALRVGEIGSEFARGIRSRGADVHLGQLLTDIVLASAVQHGAEPKQISFEVWQSNQTSIANGERTGFRIVEAPELPEARPTLQLPGTVMNGNTAYRDPSGQTVVCDTRRHMLLVKHPLLARAA